VANDNTIDIKVTATTDALKSGLASATKDVQSFGDQINDLAKRAQAVNPDAFKELAQTFNAGKVDLDEFRDGLIGITTAQTQAATQAVALAETSKLSAGGMRELVVVGREIASGNLTRLPGSLSILATRLGGIPPVAILATGAIAAFGYAIYEVIERSQKFESDLDKIQNAFTAVGAGNQFNTAQVTEYIDQLRNIPGVTEEMATAAINSFARVQNGTRVLGSATQELKPFANLIGLEVPQAAKVMADALNDPAKGLQDLRKYGVELTTSQQEQIASMMAVNNVAGAQRVLLEGIAQASGHIIDTTTGMERFWNDLGNRISGVDVKAQHARESLLAAADAADKVGNTQGARLFRDQANSSNLDTATRNLPEKPKPPSADERAAQDREAQERADTLSIERLDKMNSSLKEQEQHRHNIATIQQGIDAAERQNDQSAVRQGNAALATENQRYYGNAPKDDSDKKDQNAEIKDEAAVANARIKTEQDLVNEKQRLGQISTQEAVQQLNELAAQEHQINLRRIADMRAVAQGSGDKVGVTNANAQQSEENERYAQQKIELDQRAREAAEAEQNAEIEGARRVADAQAETTKATMALKVASGQMSAQQEINAEIQSVQQRAAEEQKFYDQQLALYQRDSAAYQKTMTDKLVAEQKTDQQILQLRTQLATQSNKQDNQLTQAVTRGLNQTVTGVLQGTQTMGQAFQRLGQNIILSVITGALDKMVTSFLANNATIQGAQQSLSNFLSISNDQNAASSELTSQQAASSAITTYAAEGAAAAIASTSAIPIIGPELAPASGAEIYADIMSFQVASAAGGMVVDQDQLAMVHENEMILPAHLSQGIGSMIANGQTGGGTNHFHFSPQINGKLGPDDIDGLHQAFTGFVQKGLRNGQFGGMRRG
jgi:hypothetical protein